MNFDSSDPSGVLLGHSVGSVKNGQIDVTASNFNESEKLQDISAASMSARLYRVNTVRRKRPRRLRKENETLPSVKELCLESLGAWETASERWARISDRRFNRPIPPTILRRGNPGRPYPT